MGTTWLYRLVPKGAFHFGQRGVGIEETQAYCPADTLFSGLCLTLQAWEKGGRGALDEWLAGFPPLDCSGPPLWLSSAFPYAGDVLFFPKPLVPARMPESVQEGRAKTLKRITFLSERIFRAWLADDDLGGELADDQLLHGGRVWVSRQELAALGGLRARPGEPIRLWSTEPVPRVTVDRAASRSQVYQAGALRFREGGGLFLLVALSGDGAPAPDRLTGLLRVLGHDGLGGERSSGYGQFEVEGPLPFGGFRPAHGTRFLTLAPYHPTQDEVAAGVLGEGASYTLETRRGWVGAPGALGLRRRWVRLLGEGSVLRHPATGPRPVYGDLVDVAPLEEDGTPALDHKVWRYGIAFPVPLAVEEGT